MHADTIGNDKLRLKLSCGGLHIRIVSAAATLTRAAWLPGMRAAWTGPGATWCWPASCSNEPCLLSSQLYGGCSLRPRQVLQSRLSRLTCAAQTWMSCSSVSCGSCGTQAGPVMWHRGLTVSSGTSFPECCSAAVPCRGQGAVAAVWAPSIVRQHDELVQGPHSNIPSAMRQSQALYSAHMYAAGDRLLKLHSLMCMTLLCMVHGMIGPGPW